MDDLISRQAAISLPVKPKEDRHYQTNNLDDAYDQGWFDLQNCIEQLPSAQPERKTGKWHRRFYPQIEMMVCSECQEEFSYDAETGIRDYNYCPNCGAKMEVEHDV